MKNVHVTLAALLLLGACSGGVQRKVLIMGQGEVNVRENKVSMSKGSGHAEKEVIVSDKGPITWTTESQTLQLPEEAGYYVVNLKTDTLVGSQQLIGRDLTNTKVMSQEELKLKIDSLENLTAGRNVNSTSNFFILPNQVQKLSSNTDAQVFGPFKKIPSTISTTGDKEPEIYKFYTNTEMRELINNLKELTY